MDEDKLILVIDDEESDVEIVADTLRDDYKVISTHSPEEGLLLAASDPHPTLILLDIIMPNIDGYEVCKRLKKNDATKDIPIIFLTIKGTVDAEHKGLELGAVDYISKPFSTAVIKARVATHIKLASALQQLKQHGEKLESLVSERTQQLEEEIAERKRTEVQLRYQATHDQLTHLPNRTLFHEYLIQSCKTATRNDHKSALLLIDLDRFKDINDSMGHFFGDQILKIVAGRLVNCVRNADMVARLGGDEFTIILQQIKTRDDVIHIVQKILTALSKPYYLGNSDKTISDEVDTRLSASTGITIYPDDTNVPETMLKYADMAMYHAKEKGRNAYEFYSPKMATDIMDKVNLEKDLYKAFRHKQLFICYQPIIDIETNRIVSAEALLRWRHKEQGLISPDVFIPIAEESDLIIELDDWVLSETCQQLEEWKKNGIVDINVAVNLSSKQFNAQSETTERIISILESSSPSKGQIHLEITENMVLEDNENLIKDLASLKEYGITLCMDDFGTGYSSLSYLRRFPIDILKIDRTFIKKSTENHSDATLVKAILSMANSLELDVIAEGVETKEQYDFLLENGCKLVQGYYFSQAIESNEFIEFYQHFNQ